MLVLCYNRQTWTNIFRNLLKGELTLYKVSLQHYKNGLARVFHYISPLSLGIYGILEMDEILIQKKVFYQLMMLSLIHI